MGAIHLRLSTRGEYGVRAMVALARAYGERPVSLSELAESEAISLSYLEQLFAELRKAGLVSAVRGAYGGYRLAKRPDEITVGDVVRPLEPVSLTSCTDAGASRDCCSRRPDCATRVFWQGVNARLTEALDSTSLADLVVITPTVEGPA
jgi:Rrf2 family cysteine metabolism transcriptional repressor